jgi:TonB-dependent receptor
MTTPNIAPQLSSFGGRLSSLLGTGLCALLLTLSAVSLRAQPGGTISGSVLDGSTGKYLEGAEVSVDGTSLRTTTAREGAYMLVDVPAGAQTVSVAYPGLETKSLPVSVVAGQTTTAPFRLGASEVVKLAEFKVAGTKEGMSQAIALQRVAINTKIVAAGDQYGDIAEGNAAEYLKFLPGVGIDYNANDARAATLRGMSTAFTNVTMNGNPMASATSGNLNRRFEFEQVSISNVETIEVFKTLTPEMQANSTGGSVNLVTKSAFDREGSLTTYRFYLQAISDDLTFKKTPGWGQEMTRKILPGVDLNYATRLTPNLGINVSYKNSQLFNDYPRSTYTWEYNPANGGTPTHPILTSWNLQNEQKDTRRQGFSAQVDYRLGDHTKLSLLGDWTYYDLIFTDRTTTLNTGTLGALATTSAQATGTSLNGLAGKGSVTFQQINRAKSGVTWDFPLNLSHSFGDGSKLEASTYWSQAYSKYRDTTGSWYSDVTITRGGTNPQTNTVTDPITVSFDNIGGVVPSYRVTDSTGTAVNLNDISKDYVTQIRSRPQTGVDTRDGLTFDYRKDFKTKIPLGVKVGGRVDDTTRNIVNPIFNRAGFGTAAVPGWGFNGVPAITGTQLISLADTAFANHSIGYGLPAYTFPSVYRAFTALGGLNYLPYTPASDVQARFDDSTKAGYVRLDVTPVENLLFVGGVRYEDRQTDVQNRLLTLAKPVSSQFSDKRWFPSLNAKYTPNSHLVFRFGYAKSIGLPDYSDLLPGPATITEPNGSVRGKVSIYNATLEPYHVDNLDASVEYYFNRSTFVSFSVFRKTLKNFIISATQGLTPTTAAALGIGAGSLGSPVDQYDITTKFNVPDAGHYNGIEASYAQNFSFLPKPFNTIGLQINGTLLSVDPIKTNMIFSSTDANLNTAILQQVNKSLELASVKQALNVTLNYSIGKVGFNISTNYTGHVLKAFSQKTVKYSDVAVNQYYNELQYQAPRETVDVRVDYKWSRRFTPYFQARNVLGRPIIMSTPTLPFNHAEYGDPIFELGVRGIW